MTLDKQMNSACTETHVPLPCGLLDVRKKVNLSSLSKQGLLIALTLIG
jgi:hypothetical protein